ncbi:hypothetical protein ACFE04_006224 [Oxalis oulophora]
MVPSQSSGPLTSLIPSPPEDASSSAEILATRDQIALDTTPSVISPPVSINEPTTFVSNITSMPCSITIITTTPEIQIFIPYATRVEGLEDDVVKEVKGMKLTIAGGSQARPIDHSLPGAYVPNISYIKMEKYLNMMVTSEMDQDIYEASLATVDMTTTTKEYNTTLEVGLCQLTSSDYESAYCCHHLANLAMVTKLKMALKLARDDASSSRVMADKFMASLQGEDENLSS